MSDWMTNGFNFRLKKNISLYISLKAGPNPLRRFIHLISSPIEKIHATALPPVQPPIHTVILFFTNVISLKCRREKLRCKIKTQSSYNH